MTLRRHFTVIHPKYSFWVYKKLLVYNFSTFETKIRMTKFNLLYLSIELCIYYVHICLLNISYTHIHTVFTQTNHFNYLYPCTDFFRTVKKVRDMVLRFHVTHNKITELTFSTYYYILPYVLRSTKVHISRKPQI